MHASSEPNVSQVIVEHPPKDRLVGIAYWIVIALGIIGLAMTVNQTFVLGLFGFQPLGNGYLYYLIGIFLAAAFLCYPACSKDANRIPWYDWLFAATAIASTAYLGSHALQIIREGWEFMAPPEAMVASCVLLALVLEGVRRCGGWPLLAVALIFGSYPLYAGYMPGFLWGNAFDLGGTIRAHILGVESVIGIPMQVVANLVIGFVLFGVALTITGGGEFFMRLATALMGKSRGGPAKVAVISSAFMGSLSGSVISNILTTGSITIPTMKRAGYPAHYAAAIEACASTGGTLMPPVMGAVAFIMASFLGVSYAEVMIAATLPALLFFVALLLQVDNYAARKNLKGLPPEEIPQLGETLKEGWPYLLSLVMLIYMLLVMRLEAYAPYYATAVLLVISLFRRHNRLNVARVRDLLIEIARSVGNLVAILAGIGLVVGGLAYTGVAGAFSRELLLYAGDSIPLMLAAGAVTSFILGMGMTVSACYIFLSILLAPALVEAGLHPLASHLFILYWGMMSYITPPVALAAITAAGMAGADATKTGLYAMRLGSVLFVLPFLFVLNPSLILQGPISGIALASISALIAIWLLASALEGYLYRVGGIGWPSRAALSVAGGALIYPEPISDFAGIATTVLLYLVHWWISRARRRGYPAAGHERSAMRSEKV
ncbi:TRAP transporter permease [Aurantimonas sp. C2-6-R+9]|uniref:TRAP transporter permease n=1 Tax=unclassified Aurantimonas TaxID=2638230 RepID=UPI002E191DA8|nr:TRAP transporter permease [Aurantimonas sp. C2-6-R+9]